MQRAKRFAKVNTIEMEIKSLYNFVDQIVDHNDAIADAYDEMYEEFMWDNSRTKWLVDHKGMSIVDAAKQAMEEERKWREDTFAWLHDPKNQNSEIYSDVYKDFYGVRPRW